MRAALIYLTRLHLRTYNDNAYRTGGDPSMARDH